MSSLMPGAASGRIDLWWVCLDDFTEAHRSRALSLLSADECERHDAFKVAPARTQFLAARALLRTTLSRYRNVAPDEWRFTANSHGRPAISRAPDNGALHFSVSHTDGLVACAVADFPELGIDVECRGRDIPYGEMAPSVLAPAEAEWFSHAPAASRAEQFLILWTLKEAYVKARGMGLSLPLNEVCFDVDVDRAHARFGGCIADDPERWNFGIIRPTSRHVLSIAAASPSGEHVTVARRTTALNLADAS